MYSYILFCCNYWCFCILLFFLFSISRSLNILACRYACCRFPGSLGGAHQASSARAGQSCGLSERAGLSERLGVAELLADRFQECPLFEGIPSGTYFYFTHGYIAPSGPFVVGETTHSVTFPSAVQYGEAAYGVQFHPEKSSDAGARLLQNFVSIVKGA